MIRRLGFQDAVEIAHVVRTCVRSMATGSCSSELPMADRLGERVSEAGSGSQVIA